jgi:hypothetical protein
MESIKSMKMFLRQRAALGAWTAQGVGHVQLVQKHFPAFDFDQ